MSNFMKTLPIAEFRKTRNQYIFCYFAHFCLHLQKLNQKKNTFLGGEAPCRL